ncbi:MAG: hypothetical protein KDC90_00855 [Ignavibacteriae bacterium]|nr:hypothetical protein [Ignavibacteriota bacterium]
MKTTEAQNLDPFAEQREKNKEIIKKLEEFLVKEISPKSLALAIRRYNFHIADAVMRDTDNQLIVKEHLRSPFYWLNDLAEILDPYIYEEDVRLDL